MDYQTRKSIRLKNYDYSKKGAYFITVCTFERARIFGEIIGGELFPKENEPNKLIEKCLNQICEKFSGVCLMNYVIMPDHVHFIIFIEGGEYKLYDIIKWFKTVTTNEYIKNVKRGFYHPFKGHLWQRNYYEHVIRDEKDYLEKYKYIEENPIKWELEWGVPINNVSRETYEIL